MSRDFTRVEVSHLFLSTRHDSIANQIYNDFVAIGGFKLDWVK